MSGMGLEWEYVTTEIHYHLPCSSLLRLVLVTSIEHVPQRVLVWMDEQWCAITLWDYGQK